MEGDLRNGNFILSANSQWSTDDNSPMQMQLAETKWTKETEDWDATHWAWWGLHKANAVDPSVA